MAASEAAGALRIERLEPRHAEDVAPLSVEAGWNQVAADWRLMIELGRAFGIRAPSGQWIATALVLPLGPAISWVSMVLVAAPARRQGLGTRLLALCLTEIEESGVAAGLDATEFGRPIYLPLGFRDVYPLSRWSVPAGVRVPVDPPAGVAIRSASADDLARIVGYDHARSGLERASVLRNLLSRAPELAHIAVGGDGDLAGYCLGRDGYRAVHIGPVVAEHEACGLALAARALVYAPGPAILDVPDQHGTLRQWLASQGASAPRGFMRMLRGTAPGVEDGSRIFALAGPELA